MWINHGNLIIFVMGFSLYSIHFTEAWQKSPTLEHAIPLCVYYSAYCMTFSYFWTLLSTFVLYHLALLHNSMIFTKYEKVICSPTSMIYLSFLMHKKRKKPKACDVSSCFPLLQTTQTEREKSTEPKLCSVSLIFMCRVYRIFILHFKSLTAELTVKKTKSAGFFLT